MHLSQRAQVLIFLTAVLAIAGLWSDEPGLRSLWCVPAMLLLAGLAYEAQVVRRTVLAARLETASPAYLGREQRAAVVVRNESARAVKLDYAPLLPAGFASMAETRRLAAPAHGEGRDVLDLLPVRLGPQAWPALPSRLCGPLGLAWWSRQLHPAAAVVVVPDTLGAHDARPRGSSPGTSVQRVSGAGAELFQLRSYRHGDPLARVDWKASARARQWVTREYSEDQHLDVLIAIDAGRFSRVRIGPLDRLGIYLNAAARLAEAVTPNDDRVGLIVFSDRTLAQCVPARGVAAVTRLRRLLEQLAVESAESDPTAAAVSIRAMLQRRALVVLLTDLDDTSVAEPLARAVRLLSPPHYVVVAAAGSTEIAALATREAREPLDPWIALAAQEHEARVSLQRSLLRRLGASVIVAPADSLERSVLSEYQALRRSRRI